MPPPRKKYTFPHGGGWGVGASPMTLGLTVWLALANGWWQMWGNLRFEIVLTQLGLVESSDNLRPNNNWGASAFSSGIVPWDVHWCPQYETKGNRSSLTNLHTCSSKLWTWPAVVAFQSAVAKDIACNTDTGNSKDQKRLGWKMTLLTCGNQQM